MNRTDSQHRLAHHLLHSQHPPSLKDYLACPSTHSAHSHSAHSHSAHSHSHTIHLSPDNNAPPVVEIQVDIGDGRSEVISVNETTDIQEEAHRFCEKYGLEGNVRDLLAESIREKYTQEKEQATLTEFERERETIREVFANVHAQPVLLSMDDSRPTRYRNQTSQNFYPLDLPYPKDSLKTAESGSSKVSTLNSRPKRHSIPSWNKQNHLEPIHNQFQINKVSEQICDRLGKENILEYRKKRSQEKMQQLIREKEKREELDMKECAFKPKINAISKKVDEELYSSKTRQQKKIERYEILYENYRAREGRKEVERAKQIMQMPFKPTINLISQKIVESQREREGFQDNDKDKTKKAHISCSQEEFKSLPHTGRHPRNRNLQGLPIGDYLYNQAMKKSKPKPHQPKPQVKANQHSDYLVCVLKQKRFNEIFTELTQPPHEELSIAEFNLSHSAFKTGYLRHFMPIFNEMIELDISLGRQEFLEASQNLFKVLSPEEKHEIVFKKEKEEKEAPVEGRSMVNSKSRQILKRSSQQSNYEGTSIYDRGLLHLRYIEDKVERDREEKVREELKICTFKPQVFRKC